MSSERQAYAPLEPNTTEAGKCSFCKCLQVCCCLVILLVLTIYGALIWIGQQQGTAQMLSLSINARRYCTADDWVDMSNVTYNIWWPGCGFVTSMQNFSDGCLEPCVDASVMFEMQKMNEELPSKMVSYPSRNASGTESLTLKGWWLPADATFPKPRPRIVMQHGFQANINEFRQQFIAFLLRSLGFDVLLSSFRDHCLSDASREQVFHWGDAYPFDTLGAWDYAKDDPDGLLGGPMEASKVGLFGFSKGGFTALNAFGLEGQIPAVWVDGAPSEPKTVYGYGLRRTLEGYGLGFLTPLVVEPAWAIILYNGRAAGVDLEKHLPANTLPQGPDTERPVYLVQNLPDTTVPDSEAQILKRLLDQYPQKYEVSNFWVLDKVCKDVDHCANHLSNMAEYRYRLCSFWASVFHTTLDVCLSGLSKTKKQSHVAAANHSDSSTSAHHPASANHSASAHHSAETHGSHPRETHI